ncbi:MAG: DUF1569 domain-containing protein [Chitinophagales bacterium]
MNNTHFIKIEISTLLQKLTLETKPLWGIMNAQNMVEHLGLLFYVSTGKPNIRISTPADKIERFQAFLMSEKTFQRNFKPADLPTDSTVPLKYKDLAEAQEKLIEQINAFYATFGNDAEKTIAHPVFGMLNLAQWEQFHRKHTQHHFRQFGLIDVV